MECPCCSGKKYADCCKKFHDGALPPTALDLMRSRYTAYALGKANYILETTHPRSPYFELDRKKWKKAILEFCRTTRFVKLEILDSGEDWVHFIAYLVPDHKNFQMDLRPDFSDRQSAECERDLHQVQVPSPVQLNERSLFEKVDGKWLYLQAT